MPSPTEVNLAEHLKLKVNVWKKAAGATSLTQRWKPLLWGHIRRAWSSHSGSRPKDNWVSMEGSSLLGGKEITMGTTLQHREGTGIFFKLELR